MINKCDRALFELKHNLETMYQNLLRVIENTNDIISTYQKKIDTMGDIQVYPDSGIVTFASTLHGWVFTLTTIAKMYAPKLKIEKKKLIK